MLARSRILAVFFAAPIAALAAAAGVMGSSACSPCNGGACLPPFVAEGNILVPTADKPDMNIELCVLREEGGAECRTIDLTYAADGSPACSSGVGCALSPDVNGTWHLSLDVDAFFFGESSPYAGYEAAIVIERVDTGQVVLDTKATFEPAEGEIPECACKLELSWSS
jgi:hypothetical protein